MPIRLHDKLFTLGLIYPEGSDEDECKKIADEILDEYRRVIKEAKSVGEINKFCGEMIYRLLDRLPGTIVQLGGEYHERH